MYVENVFNGANVLNGNTFVSLCGIGIHNRPLGKVDICNNETKCEKTMCYIVTTGLMFQIKFGNYSH